MPKPTREEIINSVMEELEECFRGVEPSNKCDWFSKVLEVNEKKRTITIKFRYNSRSQDDYIGLAFPPEDLTANPLNS